MAKASVGGMRGNTRIKTSQRLGLDSRDPPWREPWICNDAKLHKVRTAPLTQPSDVEEGSN